MADSATSLSYSALAVSRTMTSLMAVRARGINYSFGSGETRTQVLTDNELEVGRGEVMILTGPSGSGKTTLLTLIGTLRRVQDGSLNVLGRELAGMDAGRQVQLRTEIGFIFQHHNLFSSLTALENVRMATGLMAKVGAAERTGGARVFSRSWAWAVGSITCRPGSRGASGNGWRSPGPWSTSPRSCWPTSPPPPSTRPRARRSCVS